MKDMNGKGGLGIFRPGPANCSTCWETCPSPSSPPSTAMPWAGGCELALACDLTLRRLGQIGPARNRAGNYPQFRRHPAPGPVNRAGAGAMEMIWAGEHIDAQTALEWGLVQRVYSADELMPRPWSCPAPGQLQPARPPGRQGSHCRDRGPGPCTGSRGSLPSFSRDTTSGKA